VWFFAVGSGGVCFRTHPHRFAPHHLIPGGRDGGVHLGRAGCGGRSSRNPNLCSGRRWAPPGAPTGLQLVPLTANTHTHTRTLWRQTIHVVLAICISPPPPLQVFALAKVAFSRFASHTKRAKITQCPCPLVLWADPLPPSFVFSDCTRCRSNKRAVTAAYTKPRELQRSCGSGRRKVPVPPMCKYGLRVLKAKQAPSAGRSTGVRIVAPV